MDSSEILVAVLASGALLWLAMREGRLARKRANAIEEAATRLSMRFRAEDQSLSARDFMAFPFFQLGWSRTRKFRNILQGRNGTGEFLLFDFAY